MSPQQHAISDKNKRSYGTHEMYLRPSKLNNVHTDQFQ